MTLEISHSFPPDIIREILLKASVKSLSRCKSVCKEWYSLISDQHFIKSHYTLSSTNNINYQHHRLIYSTCLEYDNPRSSLVIRPLYDVLSEKSANNAVQLENPLQITRYQKFRIVGSCKGLVCLFLDEVYYDYNMCIYNPTTRRSNFFPCFNRTSWSRVYYGFGYDELSSDYKVVITIIEPKMDTKIYSLKTGKWKEIGHFPWTRPLNDGKLLNGALHWAAGDGDYRTLLDSWKIVSLDLAKETYGEILQPEYGKCCNYLQLGVSGERLCMLRDYVRNRVVDVWVMKVYGVKDSWTKLASIPYPSPYLRQILTPLCISEDGKLLLRYGPQLLIYGTKDSSSSVIEKQFYDACIVVESLVSPFPPLGLADDNGDDDHGESCSSTVVSFSS